MGEQTGPVEDEVERALASMRAGFLSGSTQIAAAVSTLEENLLEAPDAERESVRAAVAKIVEAHARLVSRMEALPPGAWDRFKGMVGLVKAQQAVLDQLGHLVKQHVLPRQLENLAVTPLPLAPGLVRNGPAPQREGLLVAQGGLQALDSLRSQQGTGRPPHTQGVRVDDDADLELDPDIEEEERRPLVAAMRDWTSRFAGLAGMALAAVLLVLLAREMKLQEAATRLAAMVGAASAPAPSARPRASTATELPQRADPAAQRADPAAAASEQPRVARLAPAEAEAADGDRSERSTELRPDERQTAPVVLDEPAAPPGGASEERFVPVVFTHKDYAAVMKAQADLRQRYPRLLGGRKGEIQPIDLGKKGVGHRLVLLPAGSRTDAAKLCDRLTAEGYGGCAVKEY